MKVILIADALTMLVRYSVMSDVSSSASAISWSLLDATMRRDDGERITLDQHDREAVEISLASWIEPKILEHHKGMHGFDALYAERHLATDDQGNVALEAALILARAAYDAGQLSVAELRNESGY